MLPSLHPYNLKKIQLLWNYFVPIRDRVTFSREKFFRKFWIKFAVNLHQTYQNYQQNLKKICTFYRNLAGFILVLRVVLTPNIPSVVLLLFEKNSINLKVPILSGQEIRWLLAPWMVIVSASSVVDVSHSIYWITLDDVSKIKFIPLRKRGAKIRIWAHYPTTLSPQTVKSRGCTELL